MYNSLNLYDWIRKVQKKKRTKTQQAEFNDKEADKYDQDMLNDDETDELDMLHCIHTFGVLYDFCSDFASYSCWW